MRKSKQPKVKSSLLSFNIATDRTDPGITSFAGLPLAVEAWYAFGLDKECSKHLRFKKRKKGPTEAEWTEVGVMVHVAGGRSVKDVEVMKKDAGLCMAWPLLDRVTYRSLGYFLEKFHDPDQEMSEMGKPLIPEETPGLIGLGLANKRLVQKVQRIHRILRATIDFDASIHESTKQNALWTYEGMKGYQPAIAYWKEQKLIVYDEFRDGNVPASMGQPEAVKKAFAALPGGIKEYFFRADSASYEHKLLRWLDRNNIRFGVTADMSPSLRKEAEKIPEDDWKPVHKRLDEDLVILTEKQLAEIPFVPEERVSRKGERPFRYVVIRVPRQMELPFDEESEASPWKYFAVCSNRWGLDAEELLWWHRERCGTVEKAHDLLKNDLGADIFPSQHFGANAAWYRFAVLAHNLIVAMQYTCLPEEWRGQRPSSFRFGFLRLAGRVVRHARTLVLILSSGASALIEPYLAARQALRTMADALGP